MSKDQFTSEQLWEYSPAHRSACLWTMLDRIQRIQVVLDSFYLEEEFPRFQKVPSWRTWQFWRSERPARIRQCPMSMNEECNTLLSLSLSLWIYSTSIGYTSKISFRKLYIHATHTLVYNLLMHRELCCCHYSNSCQKEISFVFDTFCVIRSSCIII